MKDKFIKAQQEKLTLGAIDRRQFMTSAIAAGIAIPTALSLASDAIAATPKKGGKFRMGLGTARLRIRLTQVHRKTILLL